MMKRLLSIKLLLSAKYDWWNWTLAGSFLFWVKSFSVFKMNCSENDFSLNACKDALRLINSTNIFRLKYYADTFRLKDSMYILI